MFTKLYEKIKKFIIENYKQLLIITLIFALFNFSLPYSIYTPGGMINLDKRIKSADKIYESVGSINSTYVSMVKGTIPMLLLSKILPSWDIVSNEDLTLDNENIKETLKRDKIHMQEAISNATLVAFSAANKEINITSSENLITYISEDAKTNLKLYDNIIEYDNIKFSSFNIFKDYISNKNIGDKILFKVIRDKKIVDAYAEVIEINNESKIGLMSVTINEYESNPKISVKTKSSESGGSGGLMTTLAIYNAITPTDITKDRIIAGTGTIDEYGDVGEIGGVKYKIAGAEKQGADIFLCPEENYEEAKNFTEKEGYDIIIVSIASFSEAIEYLERSEKNGK